MGSCGQAGGRVEAERLVEEVSPTSSRANAKRRELAASLPKNRTDESPCDSDPTSIRRHVEATDSAHGAFACVGIAIEATNSDQAALLASLEQGFTGKKEAIGARSPLVAKALEETEALRKARLDELVEVPRKLVESRDGRFNGHRIR